MFTGETHMPTPTKTMHFANSNSLLGNAKGVHDVVVNTLPKIEMIVHHEWYWTASCEYADVVFGVDAWPERQLPDVYGSVTNPFLQAWCSTPMERVFETLDDMECNALVASALGEQLDDPRFADYWRFVIEGDPSPYIQRVFDAGNTTRGYRFTDLHESCKKGTPFYMMYRTMPKIVGWEQTNESEPWYTKSGRLEFYILSSSDGENMPLHREPVMEPSTNPATDGTPHPWNPPAGTVRLDIDDLASRCARLTCAHPTRSPVRTTHSGATGSPYWSPRVPPCLPLIDASTDAGVLIFGPFGDFYHHDKRKLDLRRVSIQPRRRWTWASPA
jgi:nitrate reductase alpha subunit